MLLERERERERERVIVGMNLGVHMGSSDRSRGETINQTEPIGFLFFQTESNCPCAQTDSNGSFVCFFVFNFFHKKLQFKLGPSNGMRRSCNEQ